MKAKTKTKTTAVTVGNRVANFLFYFLSLKEGFPLGLPRCRLTLHSNCPLRLVRPSHVFPLRIPLLLFLAKHLLVHLAITRTVAKAIHFDQISATAAFVVEAAFSEKTAAFLLRGSLMEPPLRCC